MTFAEIVDFVSEWHKREGGAVSRRTYLALANACLDELSGIIGGIYRTYSVTITAGVASWPTGLRQVESVYWGDLQLKRAWPGPLDEVDPYWRDNTSTPTRFMTTKSTILTDSTVTGTLTVYGYGTLGHFSDTLGAANPMDLLPPGSELVVPHYMLARLPIGAEKDIGIARKIEFSDLYERGKRQMADNFRARDSQRYGSK